MMDKRGDIKRVSDISKMALRQAFGKAANCYDHYAIGQLKAIDCLLAWGQKYLKPICQSDHGLQIIEIGCGTGRLTEKLILEFQNLNFPRTHYILTDIAAQMLEQAQLRLGHLPNIEYQLLDGEDLRKEQLSSMGSVDIIISSLAFQWFHNPVTALAKWVDALQPGGHILFATMGAESFKNIRTTQQALGMPSRLRHFPDLDQFKQQCWQAQDISGDKGMWHFQAENFVCDYGNSQEMLKSFQQIGAQSADPEIATLSVPQMRHLITHLNQQTAGRQAEFHILLAHFQKQPVERIVK